MIMGRGRQHRFEERIHLGLVQGLDPPIHDAMSASRRFWQPTGRLDWRPCGALRDCQTLAGTA